MRLHNLGVILPGSKFDKVNAPKLSSQNRCLETTSLSKKNNFR